MVSVLAILLFSLLKADFSLAEKANEPKLECPVVGALSGRAKEASPKEAFRRAVEIWRANKKFDPNDSKLGWLSDFRVCLRISQRTLDEVVIDREKYKEVILQNLEARIALVNKNAEILENLSGQLKHISEVKSYLERQFPESKEELKKFVITKPEIEALAERKMEATQSEKNFCSSKDFSSRLGMVRDQEEKGWCYAFAAADLVSFKLGASTANFDRKISAADLAFSFNKFDTSFTERFFKEEDIASRESGKVEDALKNAIKNGGFCSEKDSPSENFSFGSLNEVLDEIREIDPGARSDPKYLEKICYSYLRVQDMFPGIGFENFLKIFNKYRFDKWSYFIALNKQNCEGKRHLYGIKPEHIKNITGYHGEAERKKVVQSIDDQLDSNNIVAISFFMKMIKKGGEKSHAAIVVGRRYNSENNRCEYLIRNSWGIGCSSSTIDGLCAKDHTGHLWVSRKTLERNVFRSTYIDDKN